MKEKELELKKKELMQPAYTEELHHELMNMNPNDARKIVESMSNKEIYSKVNIRRFQEDYIADYIEFLWDISKSAYWRHVIVSLDPKVGALWGDNMKHFEKMCNTKIPLEVLDAVLNFAIQNKESDKQGLEAIGCVIKAQIDKFGRIADIKSYISKLHIDDQKLAKEKIFEYTKKECNYIFG